jgi:hypothetical protein
MACTWHQLTPDPGDPAETDVLAGTVHAVAPDPAIPSGGPCSQGDRWLRLRSGAQPLAGAREPRRCAPRPRRKSGVVCMPFYWGGYRGPLSKGTRSPVSRRVFSALMISLQPRPHLTARSDVGARDGARGGRVQLRATATRRPERRARGRRPGSRRPCLARDAASCPGCPRPTVGQAGSGRPSPSSRGP